MKTIRAEKMGFCFGVREAVNTVIKVAAEKKDKKIYMLGMLVHNKIVVEELKSMGVETIEEENIDNLTAGDVVIIRAHGITIEVLEKLRAKNVEIYDSTCIFVSKIKKVMTNRIEEGYKPVIFGDANHPEVKGIISYADNVEVVANYDELLNKVPIKLKRYV